MLGGMFGSALTMCKVCWDLIAGITIALSTLQASEELLSKRL